MQPFKHTLEQSCWVQLAAWRRCGSCAGADHDSCHTWGCGTLCGQLQQPTSCSGPASGCCSGCCWSWPGLSGRQTSPTSTLLSRQAARLLLQYVTPMDLQNGACRAWASYVSDLSRPPLSCTSSHTHGANDKHAQYSHCRPQSGLVLLFSCTSCRTVTCSSCLYRGQEQSSGR